MLKAHFSQHETIIDKNELRAFVEKCSTHNWSNTTQLDDSAKQVQVNSLVDFERKLVKMAFKLTDSSQIMCSFKAIINNTRNY